MVLKKQHAGTRFKFWRDRLGISNDILEAFPLYRPFAHKTLGYFDAFLSSEPGFNQNQMVAAGDIVQTITQRTGGWWGHVTGPMNSGKSATLVRVAEALTNRSLVALSHGRDLERTRRKPIILTHGNGRAVAAQPYLSLRQVRSSVEQEVPGTIFLVDELQFAEGVSVASLTQLLMVLKQRGSYLVTGGLDTTFLREPWENTEPVFRIAESIFFLSARCQGDGGHCGLPGIYSQRLIEGKPAKRSDPTVLIGKEQLYRTVCPIHHEIGG